MLSTAEGTLHFLLLGIFMCEIARFCVFNAEELNQDLLRCGDRFVTAYDTEVILCGYMEYGMEVAEKRIFDGTV